MMTNTVFKELSLDRGRVRWEQHLGLLTPWELRGPVWPLFANGVQLSG